MTALASYRCYEVCVDVGGHVAAFAVLYLSPAGRGRLRSSRVRGMDKFKARARKLRASQTSAEAKLWQALRNRRLARWKFRRQHSINRYVVDFVTLDGKLIVEVDGVTHAEPSELARDKARTDVLEACGFLVVRVSNTDVYDNLEGVLEMIESTLRPD
jgi:very-short-patch-repair endonuclease